MLFSYFEENRPLQEIQFITAQKLWRLAPGSPELNRSGESTAKEKR